MMAAFTGRELCFCEPFLPHAWPIKYRLKTDYSIVGLAAFGTMLAILTTGTPYRADVPHPDLAQMAKIEENLPCVSARGIVDLGYACVYPSPEGLVLLSVSGAQNATRGVVTLDQWQAMNPAGFVAAQWNGQYMASHQPVGASTREIALFDVRGQVPSITRMNHAAQDLDNDLTSAKIYMLIGGTDVQEFHATGAAPATYRWRSKLYDLPFPNSYSVVQIDGTPGAGASPAHQVRVIADGTVIHTSTVLNGIYRLPGDIRAEEWQIEIEGNADVETIVLAESMEMLTL